MPPAAPTPAAGVAEVLSRYEAVFEDGTRGERHLAEAWQGSAAEEAELAHLITSRWQVPRAIAGNPVLLAALRQQTPNRARQVEASAGQDRSSTLITRARQTMPQSSPEPHPSQEPEHDPDPPSFGMRM